MWASWQVGILSRLKLYATLGALAIPTIGPAYLELSATELGLATGMAVAGSLSLLAVARITTRLVGVISLHDKEELIRVGYLTFWGKRRNAVVPIANVAPFGDYLDPAALGPLTMKADLRRAGATGPLYIPTFGMEVLDRTGFEYVFGPSFFTDQPGPKPKEKAD